MFAICSYARIKSSISSLFLLVRAANHNVNAVVGVVAVVVVVLVLPNRILSWSSSFLLADNIPE